MNIKINKHGCIEIKRKDEYEEMSCMYDVERFCGDSCVKFREPILYGFSEYGQMYDGVIKLCNDDYIPFTSLEDER